MAASEIKVLNKLNEFSVKNNEKIFAKTRVLLNIFSFIQKGAKVQMVIF